MSDEWEAVSLGEVFSPLNVKLGKHQDEPVVMSLSKYDGFVRADEYFDKRIASKSLDGYKVVEPLGWAFSTIHIDEGSIARNNLGVRGVISPMYTTMAWTSEQHEPRFFERLLRTPQMLAFYKDNAQGTVNRRRSLPFKKFAELKVTVPPLQVQRRIVDLLEYLDTHLANLRAEESACLTTLNRLRGKSWHTGEVLLEAVVTDIESGFSVRTGGDEPDAEQARILKVSAVRPGRFQPRESKALNANTAMPDRALVSVGDLLITRSNTPDRVGYCARARTVPPRTFFPDLVWRLSLDEAICDPDYFEQILASDIVRDRITATASGTSASMRKINRPGLRSVSIPLPTLAEQREFAETCLSAADTAEALSDEVQRLSQLRVQLLASLLSRDVEIPDSYDELVNMEVAS